MKLVPLIVALCALAYSVWVRIQIKRQTRADLERLREREDVVRSRFTQEQLDHLDRHFEQRGIARR